MNTPSLGKHGQQSSDAGPGSREKDSVADQVFGQRLAHIRLPDLYYVDARFPDELHINLPNLHRMMLHSLQRELVEEVSKIRQTVTVGQEQARTIRTALSNFASSIRDWELMVACSKKADGDPSSDPYVLTSSRPLEHKLMAEAGLTNLAPESAHRIKVAIEKERATLPPIFDGTRLHHNKQQREREFWKRLRMALFGGVALVGPMLIMVLYKHLLTSLVTVSLSVFLFALVVAVFSTGTPENVLTAVAAYAAVLVVFVGASS